MSRFFSRLFKGPIVGLLKSVVLVLAAARIKEKVANESDLSATEKELINQWVDTTIAEVTRAVDEDL